MAIKESLMENKDFILESLPTQELKDEFLASLENVEEQPGAVSIEEAVAEAQSPDHVTEDMYEGIKKELENMKSAPRLTPEEEKAAIEAELKNVPTEPNDNPDEEGTE